MYNIASVFVRLIMKLLVTATILQRIMHMLLTEILIISACGGCVDELATNTEAYLNLLPYSDAFCIEASPP